MLRLVPVMLKPQSGPDIGPEIGAGPDISPDVGAGLSVLDHQLVDETVIGPQNVMNSSVCLCCEQQVLNLAPNFQHSESEHPWNNLPLGTYLLSHTCPAVSGCVWL